MTTSIQDKLNRFTFPSTNSKMLPTESLADLKLELLTISRMYANMPFNSIDMFVVNGMNRQDFIAKIYNRLYNQVSYPVDCLLDKIVSNYEEGL